MNPMVENNELQKLMLLGAMYVEENGILQAIHDNVDEDIEIDDLKEILVEGYCALNMNMDEVDTDSVKELIEDAWGVTNKFELIETLDSLLSGHHQNIFDDLIEKNSKNILNLKDYQKQSSFAHLFKEMEEEEFHAMVTNSLASHKLLNSDGLIGWDWARYVHLLRLGHLAGYMNETESFKFLKKLERPVKERFKNWISFSNSFENGRLFWSGNDEAMAEAIANLKEDSWSPWKILGWFE